MTNGAFPVPQQTVEAGVLHSCSNIEQWLQLSEFGEEDWTSHREIWRFYSGHLLQYGTLPTSSQVSTRFQWSPPIGEFRYWLGEMKKYSLARRILAVIQEGYREIGDPAKSLNTLLDKLSLVRSQESNQVQATDASAMNRLELFDRRTEYIFNSDQMLGMRTGLNIIDSSRTGWMPGDLIGIFSRPGVGKTWFEAWEGVINWCDGKRILIISPEMPANRLNLRIDLLVANALGHTIDYNKLMLGDPSIRAEYALTCEALAQSNRWWTYSSINDGEISLGDVAALIKQHQPDMAFVDGISLLQLPGNNRDQTWEQMKKLCYGLKNIATVNNIPIMVSHQAVNSARGRRTQVDTIGRGDDFHMPSLNDAAYGDAFVGACSDVITMCAEPSSTHINWYSLRKTRERGWRQPLPPRMGLIVDFATGRIHDAGQYGNQPETVGQEARRILGVL